MRELKFIKAEPIGRVYREGQVFTINVGEKGLSIKLVIRNYWIRYGQEDLDIQVDVNTDKRIIQELMKYPVRLNLVGGVKNET